MGAPAGLGRPWMDHAGNMERPGGGSHAQRTSRGGSNPRATGLNHSCLVPQIVVAVLPFLNSSPHNPCLSSIMCWLKRAAGEVRRFFFNEKGGVFPYWLLPLFLNIWHYWFFFHLTICLFYKYLCKWPNFQVRFKRLLIIDIKVLISLHLTNWLIK